METAISCKKDSHVTGLVNTGSKIEDKNIAVMTSSSVLVLTSQCCVPFAASSAKSSSKSTSGSLMKA